MRRTGHTCYSATSLRAAGRRCTGNWTRACAGTCARTGSPARAKVVDSVGSFERIGAPSARQFGGYTVVDVPLAFAAGGAIGEVVFGRDGKVAGLALEFPYPRPRQPEPGRRWGGFMVRNPEIDGLMRIRP